MGGLYTVIIKERWISDLILNGTLCSQQYIYIYIDRCIYRSIIIDIDDRYRYGLVHPVEKTSSPGLDQAVPQGHMNKGGMLPNIFWNQL